MIPGLMLMLFLSSPSPQTDITKNNGEIEILSGTDSMTVEVNLKPLGQLSSGLKAILAFYAMRANGGCPLGDWDQQTKIYKMECPLTSALGLGYQCSDAQIGLVKTWFKDGIPALGLLSQKDTADINRSKNFASACNATPYTATHQSIWSSIRVQQLNDGIVTVKAEGDWTAGPDADSGSFTAVTTYRILADRVKVVSHKEESH